jgi:hypothetical protein
MFTRSGLILTGSLILAGCSQNQPETRQTAVMPPQTASIRVQPPAAPGQHSAIPHADIEDLMGAGASRIDQLLGTPEIVRREGQGELRLYRSPYCVLHVFLYPHSGVYQATHIEARVNNTRQSPAQIERCVASFA